MTMGVKVEQCQDVRMPIYRRRSSIVRRIEPAMLEYKEGYIWRWEITVPQGTYIEC